MDIIKETKLIGNYLISLRKDFHKHPELGMEEYRTSKRIKEELDKIINCNRLIRDEWLLEDIEYIGTTCFYEYKNMLFGLDKQNENLKVNSSNCDMNNIEIYINLIICGKTILIIKRKIKGDISITPIINLLLKSPNILSIIPSVIL